MHPLRHGGSHFVKWLPPWRKGRITCLCLHVMTSWWWWHYVSGNHASESAGHGSGLFTVYICGLPSSSFECSRRGLHIHRRSRSPFFQCKSHQVHYTDKLWHVHCTYVIMSAMPSQITSFTIVYSTVYLGADQRKHQSPASLASVRVIHRWPVNS